MPSELSMVQELACSLGEDKDEMARSGVGLSMCLLHLVPELC